MYYLVYCRSEQQRWIQAVTPVEHAAGEDVIYMDWGKLYLSVGYILLYYLLREIIIIIFSFNIRYTI